jgi:hypothetical protein
VKNPIASSLLILGALAGASAEAQETPAWMGAPACRLAAVNPAPARPPSWSGPCKDGYADGKGTLEWVDAASKRYRLEAEFVAGRVPGEGTLHAPDGSVYTGTLNNGVPDGHGYLRTADGTQFEGDVRMGKADGMAEALFADGDEYNGQFKNGKRDGIGTLTWPTGGRYEGSWKDDKPSGPGKIVYAGTAGREVAVQDGHDPTRKPGKSSGTTYTVWHDDRPVAWGEEQVAARRIPVPPALSYKELTPEQQASVASWYNALAPGDEPPYPVGGPAEFYQAMSTVVGRLQLKGEVFLYVRVGTDGKARGVKVFGLDDPAVRKIVASLAAAVKYKPAVCAGQPCEMVYPYHLGLGQKR